MSGTIRGVIYGQALGDAAGWPFEFEHEIDIRHSIENGGIPSVLGVYTDDTQMMLACVRGIYWHHYQEYPFQFGDGGAPTLMESVYRSYQDWAHTQNDSSQRRAPGITCMRSLGEGRMGSLTNRINNSKGNGGIMRVAPYGIVSPTSPIAYARAVHDAALTHSHVMGFVPAGIHAALINLGLTGVNIHDALNRIIGSPQLYFSHPDMKGINDNEYDEISNYLDALLELRRDYDKQASPHSWIIHTYGRGTADTTLYVALYALLKYEENFEAGVEFCIVCNDDSDTFAAVYGALYGAFYGDEGLPASWLTELEEKDELEDAILTLERLVGLPGSSDD